MVEASERSQGRRPGPTRGRRGRAARRTRRGAAIALAVLVAPLGVHLGTPAAAETFTNTTPITITQSTDGLGAPATPYPSKIAVSGRSGTVADVNITLNGLQCTKTFAFPEDLDIMLVSPSGANALVMSDVGGDNTVALSFPAINLTIDDQAAQPLPADTQLTAGSFRPVDDDDDPFETSLVDSFYAPAPALSGSTALSTFNGTTPNGFWSLYVVDDYYDPEFGVDNCEITNGWTLDLLTTGVSSSPTAVAATPGNGQATVSWTAPASTGGSPITGYTVTGAPGGQTCTTTAALSCTVTGLTNGSSYTFTVVATNAVGPSQPSAPSNAVVPAGPPGAPTAAAATAGNGQATVTWSAPASANGSPVTGYTVTGAPGGQTCTTTAALSCTVTGLTNGTSYTFTVVAQNAVGPSSPSAPSNAVVPLGAPGAPTGVTAAAGNGQATVAWAAPASNGGSPITRYTVTGAPGGQTCTTTGALSCTVTGLTNGSGYTFTVVATNAVGDGPPSAPSNAIQLSAGYRLVGSDGGIFIYGNAAFYGSTGATALASPIVGMADTVSRNGYWLAAADGEIFSFGDAVNRGSVGTPLARPIVGIERTPSGNGYWLVAADGGIFAFGDAGFHGSTGALALAKPIVGMATSPSGNGYWLVAADGGIFSFGDAGFHGSTGAMALAKPIVGMEKTPSGNGYWLVASDGGIFAFGDAGFRGSMGGTPLARPIVGMERTPSGNGYWMVAADGGIFTFGDAAFSGSTGGSRLARPIVGMAA